MSAAVLGRTPPAGYEKIGDGEHSEVYRRPGSRYCLQLFTVDCPELTPTKVRREYAYLRQVYRSMPGLIPAQWLFIPRPRAHISQTRLCKAWVDVDTSRPLNRVRRRDLNQSSTAQLEQFITLTRGLLHDAHHREAFLPDIIDARFQNLALDTGGRLRLLDTNRLINTGALRRLEPHQRLDIGRRWIHARWLRRLMYLEAAFCDRSQAQLRQDPLYARYLTPGDLDVLFRQSAADGEVL